jgi:hypothetical protein
MTQFLTQDQIDFFDEQGYLVIDAVIPEAALLAVKAEYDQRMHDVAKQFVAAGKLDQTHAQLPFGERFTRLLFDCPDILDFLEITLPLLNEGMPPGIEMHHGPAVFSMLRHPHLLDLIESLLGPEISSNPVQHLRIKPPANQVPESLVDNSYVSTTTWHQDQGALMDEADQTQLITAWVAITDATLENGCMVCIPKSHRIAGGSLAVHCPGAGIASENFIPPELLDLNSEQPLPVSAGGVVLLNQFTQHAAGPNTTNSIRWSFDLRFHRTGQASGRPAFPDFVARSRKNPELELRDPVRWGQLWESAYNRILEGQSGPIFNAARWAIYADSPVCA